MIQAIQKIRKEPDIARLDRISELLGKIDVDRDGVVKVDDVLKVSLQYYFLIVVVQS